MDAIIKSMVNQEPKKENSKSLLLTLLCEKLRHSNSSANRRSHGTPSVRWAALGPQARTLTLPDPHTPGVFPVLSSHQACSHQNDFLRPGTCLPRHPPASACVILEKREARGQLGAWEGCWEQGRLRLRLKSQVMLWLDRRDTCEAPPRPREAGLPARPNDSCLWQTHAGKRTARPVGR